MPTLRILLNKVLISVALTALIAQPATAAELLLIIDDLGNNRLLGEQAVALPAPVNLAFLPHTPHAAHLAEAAFHLGHGIMLHAPMAAEQGARLGPGGLKASMDQHTLQQTLISDLDAVPHAQGLNNHMGSLLTQQPQAMRWVMDVARQRGLFFIDSLTSPASVALQQAQSAGIPALKRDVFLDNETDDASLRRQFEQALQLAHKRGYAVLIAHPYPQTLNFLNHELVSLEPRDIHLRRVDEFLYQRLWARFSAPSATPSRYLLHSNDLQQQP